MLQGTIRHVSGLIRAQYSEDNDNILQSFLLIFTVYLANVHPVTIGKTYKGEKLLSEQGMF